MSNFSSRPKSSRNLRRRLAVEPLEQRLLLAVCDPNEDGEVTGGDVAALAFNYGMKEGASERQGDCNGDGQTNLFDVGVLQSGFGLRAVDFGDAADGPYPTRLESDGARHAIRSGFHLGAGVDRESDGPAGGTVHGDDTDADGDDEDGVFFYSTPTPGEREPLRVMASAAGRLDAWADWNRDGDWDDVGEQIFASETLVTGTNALEYLVPVDALTDRERATQARFRFSSAGGLTPRGLASDGEVEDYALFVYDAAAMPPSTRHSIVWDAQADLESATEEGSVVRLEASGPTTIELSPAINLDNGLPVALGGPDTLPSGSWFVDTRLVDIALTGTMSDPEEIELDPCFIKSWSTSGDADSSGEILLTTLPDGELQIDSFFDLFYQIELANTRTPTEIRPGDGSVRVESHRRIRAATLNDWLPRALELELAESEVGDPHVDVNSPHAVQHYLNRLSLQIPLFDRGDAPDGPYPTLAASGGAAHVIRPGYSFGPSVDFDAGGQPHPIAEGDDGDADGDDENGVVLTSAVAPGGMTSVDVTAVGGKGYLNAWADFNRNGAWESSEQIFTSHLLSVGVSSLSFAVPASTLPDSATLPPVISRWRFSRQQALTTTGLSSSGEVEDHLLRVGPASTRDFGDAPKTYPTRLADGGASHAVLPGVFLGRSADADTDGQPDPAAQADDSHGGPDDEDGVTFTTPIIPGGVADVTVEASTAGRLDAFVDFNRNGVWEAPAESVFTSLPLAAGLNMLEFSVPANAAGGRTYARFRFSRAGGLAPTGAATDGEVEDHAVYIEPPAESRTSLGIQQSDLEFVRGTVQFAPPTFIDVELSGETWTQVLVAGAQSLAGHDGTPAVPIYRQIIALPHGASVSARSMRVATAYEQRIDEVFGTQGLLPFQPDPIDEVTLLEDYPSDLFDNPTTLTIDRQAYATNAPFPREVVSFTPLGKLRDLDVGLLEIAAGQYNPVEKRLTLFGAVEWEVSFAGGDRYFLPREAKNPFENATPLYEGVLNSEAVLQHYQPGLFQPIPCGPADLGEELMILTHPTFRAAADTLASWKEQKGIATTVFEVGIDTPRDTQKEIYDLINFRYDNCPVRPSYAMLLGDSEFIPTAYHQQVGGAAKVKANQDVDNGQWVLLGTVNFKADGGEKIELLRPERTGEELHNGRTVADAVKLVKVSTGQATIVDNEDPGFSTSGNWGESEAVDEYDGSSLITVETDATATWPLPNLPGQGLYEVWAWWSAEAPNGGKYYRDMTAQYRIFSANTGTDIPYTQVFDDLFFSFLPAIGIGRAPVDSLAQAENVVNKIIAYEQTPPGSVFDSSFYEHATVAAAFEGYRTGGQSGRDQKAFVEGAEGARNTLMAAGYTVDRIYGKTEKDNPGQAPPNRYYNGALLPTDLRASSNFPWDGTDDDVVDAINDGRFLVIHRDHAGAGGWATPGFGTGDFGDLANGDETPIVYSINCSSGNFDNETSGSVFKTDPSDSYFAERLLRRGGSGAVGVIAATRTTSSAANTVLIRGLMDATWPFSEPDVGGNTSIRRLGDILNYGKVFMISKVGVPSTFIEIGLNHVANTMSLYQTFGDPTLEMWTENPHRLVMPAVIDYDLTGTVSIELRYGVAGAKVTAFQKVDGKLMPLGRVMTDSRGQATMDTFGFDPALPIVFAACREDAVCIAPTGRRGASGSPEAPEAAVAVAAMASDRTPPPNTPLAARRAPMDPMVVDSVLSRSDSVGSQAASSLRVLRASRRAVRAEL